MKILYTVFSDLKYDQRVRQEIKTLSGKYDVRSVSVGEKIGAKDKIAWIINVPGIRFVIAWINFFIVFLSINPDLIIFADINTAPPVLLWRLFFNIPIVFDMHEIGSEMKEKQSFFSKLFWKIVEYITLRNADAVLTVSESLAEYAKKWASKDVFILYNYPSEMFWNSVSQGDNKRVCYVGALAENRGLEALVKAFKGWDGFYLNIIGSGKLERKLKLMASDAKNIKFTASVSIERLENEIRKSGIGVILNEGKSLNNRKGLPNKIFQYIRAGMPFVCSDMPEMKRIALHTGAGVVCEINEVDIKSAIKEVSLKYEKFRRNALKYRNEFVWEKQEKILTDLVSRYE